MIILSWLKKIVNNVFYFLRLKNGKGKQNITQATSEPQDLTGTSSKSFTTRAEVVDLLAYLPELKAEVESKLKDLKKEIENITSLKEDAKKAGEKSEKTENIVFFGFVVFLAMLATVALAHLDLIRSESEKNIQDSILYEKIINQQADIKIFKNCLNISKWLNPKCFEN